MKKVTSRWEPHQLTDEQRVKLCRENLSKFQNDSCRLCDIIRGDETWIYHREIHCKSKNANWLDEGQSTITVICRGKKNFFSK